jgi:hypothetical protein
MQMKEQQIAILHEQVKEKQIEFREKMHVLEE